MAGLFDNRHILVAITGGIAAYRACDLIRELFRQGCRRVTAIMTPGATQFIQPMTLHCLTTEPVCTDEWAMDPNGTPIHIALAQQADAMLVLPATANTLAKFAYGMADNIVTTTALTMTGKPVVLAPAMNTRMWQNPATRANLEILAQRENMTIVPPGCGLLACGETGEGHLADQETVLLWLARALNGKEAPLLRRHVVVTAGGTQEPIDPVRVITNKSSGKMGIALADAAFMLGADVTLLAAEGLADSLEKPYSVEAFTTAESLLNKAKDAMTTADWLIMAAAVGDYKAAESLEHKIKRSESPELSIQLRANPDILATLSRNKRPDQRLIGFAAETRDLANQARQKLARKGCDAIIANDVSRSDIGFSSADNEVTLFTVDGLATTLPKQPKRTLAIEILKTLASSWTPGHGEPAQAMTETSLTRP